STACANSLMPHAAGPFGISRIFARNGRGPGISSMRGRRPPPSVGAVPGLAITRREREMFRRFVRAAALVAVLGATTPTAALADAGGNGTVTITQHAYNDVLLSEHVTNPCTGEPGTVTAIAANEVFHVTYFTNGDEFWATGTGEGTATFTPDDPDGVSASGHF